MEKNNLFLTPLAHKCTMPILMIAEFELTFKLFSWSYFLENTLFVTPLHFEVAKKNAELSIKLDKEGITF